MIKGSTRLVAIVGTPVAQVKSPENFNAAFDELQSNVAMIAMDISPQGMTDFLSLARQWENLDGFVVTIPHKQAAAAGVDSITPRAALLGAANVVRRNADGTLTGDMVDGLGFLKAAQNGGFAPSGKNALLIGCGGAGSAIAHALCEAGVAELAIVDTDMARAEKLADLLRMEFEATVITTRIGDPSRLDLVTNATPVGMKHGDPLPLADEALAMLKPGTHVADIVTSPEVTPFLAAARARGLSIQTGSQMAKAQLTLLGAHMGVLASRA